jgi:hypothetical protein
MPTSLHASRLVASARAFVACGYRNLHLFADVLALFLPAVGWEIYIEGIRSSSDWEWRTEQVDLIARG